MQFTAPEQFAYILYSFFKGHGRKQLEESFEKINTIMRENKNERDQRLRNRVLENVKKHPDAPEINRALYVDRSVDISISGEIRFLFIDYIGDKIETIIPLDKKIRESIFGKDKIDQRFMLCGNGPESVFELTDFELPKALNRPKWKTTLFQIFREVVEDKTMVDGNVFDIIMDYLGDQSYEPFDFVNSAAIIYELIHKPHAEVTLIRHFLPMETEEPEKTGVFHKLKFW